MAEMFLVGGAVRDQLMGKTPHDFDFTVVTDSYFDMKFYLEHDLGVEIFVEHPENFTIRGRFPKDSTEVFAGYPLAGQAVDFVLARKERGYSDGRHPDEVEVGSLYDDLSRRDFTMNAIALAQDGTLIDPFGGQDDIQDKALRAVGNAKERLLEDALRVVRALRFTVTKQMQIDSELQHAMYNMQVIDALADNVAADRIRIELSKMFAEDPIRSMTLLNQYPDIRNMIFGYKGMNLQPTLAEVSTR